MILLKLAVTAATVTLAALSREKSRRRRRDWEPDRRTHTGLLRFIIAIAPPSMYDL
jgi:hypothetical protein